MTPTVSVIVTCFNYGRYVGAALESVRSQTLRDFEAIVIDDGSTDDSLQVIEGFLTDRRFRLIRQKHAGQPRTKNRGLTEARAPFVAYLDADDVWAPTKLAKQLDLFESDAGLGVVCTRRTLIDPDGNPRPHGGVQLPRGRVVDHLFRQNFVCFSSAMLRIDVARHVGGFDDEIPLAIDYDFWLRAARHYRFGVVDELLVAYRVGHVNLSRRQLDRLYVARLIMERFVAHYDSPAVLAESARMRAEAETFAHLGVIARGYSRRAGVGWLARALRRDPWQFPAWRSLASAVLPDSVRRVMRRVCGSSGAWERQCHTSFNRPEPIL